MQQTSSVIEDLVFDVAEFAQDYGRDLQRDVILPAFFDTIGPVKGKDVLEIYCGAGHVSRRLAALGARVTAVDPSDRLLGIAEEINAREKQRVKYVTAEPADLSALDDSAFDEIVCNMGLMVARDLGGSIAELARLVKLGGRFTFSILHPSFCMPDSSWVGDEDGRLTYKTVDNYFAESWWTTDLLSHLRSNRGRIKHRTISRYVNALGARGFTVRRMIEPRPSPEVVAYRPHLEIYERLPAAMIIEAVFPSI